MVHANASEGDCQSFERHLICEVLRLNGEDHSVLMLKTDTLFLDWAEAFEWTSCHL